MVISKTVACDKIKWYSFHLPYSLRYLMLILFILLSSQSFASESATIHQYTIHKDWLFAQTRSGAPSSLQNQSGARGMPSQTALESLKDLDAEKQTDYQIGPEDVLEIRVWNHDDLTRQVQVSQSGEITFPMIGQISAAGHSAGSLEAILNKALGDGYIVNPQATVKVVEYRSQRVYVVGYVNKPGVVPLTGPTPIMEAISLAGGMRDDGGNDVLVIRPANPSKNNAPSKIEEAKPSEVIQINIIEIQSGNVSKNLLLRNSDTVIVPKAKYFYVFGEVQKPGQYKYEGPISVLQAMTIAGGTTQKASTRSTKITREVGATAQEIPVMLNDPVQPGDIVTVPESFF